MAPNLGGLAAPMEASTSSGVPQSVTVPCGWVGGTKRGLNASPSAAWRDNYKTETGQLRAIDASTSLQAKSSATATAVCRAAAPRESKWPDVRHNALPRVGPQPRVRIRRIVMRHSLASAWFTAVLLA